MFIIPLTGKLSWRNLPFVTIAVILINCLVWFVFQAGETEKQYKVSEFYFSSGLADLEVSRYIAYREDRLEEYTAADAPAQLDQETLVQFLVNREQAMVAINAIFIGAFWCGGLG